jgi:hypothetical protein
VDRPVGANFRVRPAEDGQRTSPAIPRWLLPPAGRSQMAFHFRSIPVNERQLREVAHPCRSGTGSSGPVSAAEPPGIAGLSSSTSGGGQGGVPLAPRPSSPANWRWPRRGRISRSDRPAPLLHCGPSSPPLSLGHLGQRRRRIGLHEVRSAPRSSPAAARLSTGLNHQIGELADHVNELRAHQEDRIAWLSEHPWPSMG